MFHIPPPPRQRQIADLCADRQVLIEREGQAPLTPAKASALYAVLALQGAALSFSAVSQVSQISDGSAYGVFIAIACLLCGVLLTRDYWNWALRPPAQIEYARIVAYEVSDQHLTAIAKASNAQFVEYVRPATGAH